MRLPSPLERLISLFSRLPSVGPKTAERYVFYLLKQKPELIEDLANALHELPKKIITCDLCNGLTETNPCAICKDKERDQTILCVIADERDLFVLEDTNIYKGLYFVLGGTINTLDSIGPDKINIKGLVARVKQLKPKEVILGLNPTLDGETTSLYISKLLKPAGIKITRLAKGLPSGANIEYADSLTLGHALKFRNEI
jgi:recombination protein RecR